MHIFLTLETLLALSALTLGAPTTGIPAIGMSTLQRNAEPLRVRSSTSGAPSTSAPMPFSAQNLISTNLVIDSSCEANQKAHPGLIENSLADAYALANAAKSMPVNAASIAFTDYFDVKDSDDVKTVPKMFEAILTASPNQKFQVTCPSVAQVPACKGNYGLTDASPLNPGESYTLRLCPPFFTEPEMKQTLASRVQLCRTPIPAGGRVLDDFLTGGHTVLHEMTHVWFIADKAGMVDNRTPGSKIPAVTDIRPKSGETTHLQVARRIKGDWNTYEVKLAAYKALSTAAKKKAKRPTKPPQGAVQNAECYAAAATEHYFSMRPECRNFLPINIK